MAARRFNYAKKHLSRVFVCEACAAPHNYERARYGCSSCGHYLFRVANRGTGYPRFWERDLEDPYYRQRRKPYSGQDEGGGHKLVQPGDEEYFGAGFGGRARGDKFPGDEASGEGDNKYDQQQKKDVPGSYDDGEIDVPGDIAAERSYQIPEEFTDPIDPLSRANESTRELSKDRQPLDNQLNWSRNFNSRGGGKSDSIFENLRRRQQGIRI